MWLIFLISLGWFDWLFFAYLLIVAGGVGTILILAQKPGKEIACLRHEIMKLRIENEGLVSQNEKVNKRIDSLYKIQHSQSQKIRELKNQQENGK
jgi:hypothetical protein